MQLLTWQIWQEFNTYLIDSYTPEKCVMVWSVMRNPSKTFGWERNMCTALFLSMRWYKMHDRLMFCTLVAISVVKPHTLQAAAADARRRPVAWAESDPTLTYCTPKLSPSSCSKAKPAASHSLPAVCQLVWEWGINNIYRADCCVQSHAHFVLYSPCSGGETDALTALNALSLFVATSFSF